MSNEIGAWDVLTLTLAANKAKDTPEFDAIDQRRIAAVEQFKSQCHPDPSICRCCGRKLPRSAQKGESNAN